MTSTLWVLCALVSGRHRLEQANDRLLVHLTARGEAQALEVLHRRYYSKLYKLAFVKLGNEEDAHDVACEAFVRAVQNVFHLDPLSSASLYPWLHTVVINLCVDAYRRHANVETVTDAGDVADLLSVMDRIEDDGPSPEEVVARKEVQRAVLQALAQLPEAQAQAIYYRFIGELSLAQIGDVMGKSEGAIKSLLHRGILNLRARIAAMTQSRRRRVKAGRVSDVNGDTISIHRRTSSGT